MGAIWTTPYPSLFALSQRTSVSRKLKTKSALQTKSAPPLKLQGFKGGVPPAGDSQIHKLGYGGGQVPRHLLPSCWPAAGHCRTLNGAHVFISQKQARRLSVWGQMGQMLAYK